MLCVAAFGFLLVLPLSGHATGPRAVAAQALADAAQPVVVAGQMLNSAGGWIKLLGTRGACDEGWREVTSADPAGEVRFRGCWIAREDKVGILWNDGDGRVYPRKAFGLGESL